MEDDDQVDVKLNLEVSMMVSCTRVIAWEQHVKRDLQVRENIAISDLDILNLGRVRLAFKSLDTHQLDFNRLNLDL